MKDAKTQLGEIKGLLDPKIDEFFVETEKFLSQYSELTTEMFRDIHKIAKGGKRLRGGLVYKAYQMYGGKDLDGALEVAAALELVHLYILVEDDFMDKADMRRGVETINHKYTDFASQYIENRSDATHFANSITINVALILCHLALNKMLNSGIELERVVKAQEALNTYIGIVGVGQTHDVLNEVKPDLTEKDVLQVLHWKTATYTYENPLHVGALLAGASQEDLDLLSAYAVPAGMAFQMQDDILGLFGDEKKTGKSILTDVKEGKRTLLMMRALESATPDQKEILEKALGNPDLTVDDLEDVKKVVKETGALDQVKKQAIKHVEESVDALSALTESGAREEEIQFLQGIADYMINRDL